MSRLPERIRFISGTAFFILLGLYLCNAVNNVGAFLTKDNRETIPLNSADILILLALVSLGIAAIASRFNNNSKNK